MRNLTERQPKLSPSSRMFGLVMPLGKGPLLLLLIVSMVVSTIVVFTGELQLAFLLLVGLGLLAVLYVNPSWGIILIIWLQTVKRTFAIFVGMVPFLTVNRLLVIWLFASIMVRRFMSGDRVLFYSHPMNRFIGLYGVWIIVTSILSVNYTYAAVFYPKMIGNLILLFLLYQLTFNEKQLKVLILGFIYLLCFSGLVAELGRKQSGASVFGTKHIGEEARAGTLGVGQANSFAVIIVLLLVIIGVLYWWKQAGIWTRIGLSTSFVLYTFFLSRTYSRTGMMLSILAMMTFVVYFRRKLNFKKFLVGAIIVLLILSLVVSEKVISRFQSISKLAGGVYSEDTSIQNRWGTLIMVTSIVSQYPIFGVGPGNYIYMTSLREYRHLVRGLRRQEGQVMAHNMYAQVIGELGIPGFLIFMYIIYLGWCDLAICRRRLVQSEGTFLWGLVHGMTVGWPFYLMGAFTLDLGFDKGFWLILSIPIIIRRLLEGADQGEVDSFGLIRPVTGLDRDA